MGGSCWRVCRGHHRPTPATAWLCVGGRERAQCSLCRAAPPPAGARGWGLARPPGCPGRKLPGWVGTGLAPWSPAREENQMGLLGARPGPASPTFGPTALLSEKEEPPSCPQEAREGGGTPCPPPATPPAHLFLQLWGRGGVPINCRPQDRSGLVCSGEVHTPDTQEPAGPEGQEPPSGSVPFIPAQHGVPPGALDWSGPHTHGMAERSEGSWRGRPPLGLGPSGGWGQGQAWTQQARNMRLWQKAEPTALPGRVGRVPA